MKVVTRTRRQGQRRRRSPADDPDRAGPGSELGLGSEAGAGSEPGDLVGRLLGTVADDPTVTEVMINGPGPVWIERAGRVEATPTEVDRHAIELLIEAVVAPLGLRVDRSSPMIDARLADGSRVNVVVPPLAIGGPAISIRRFPRAALSLDWFGPPALRAILRELVTERASVLVVGPTSSGKTSLVAALTARTEPTDRIVCIEDTAELPIERSNLVRLEARPPNSEGVGQVTLRQLVLTALRMRPDRLIIGEVRGAEAFDLLLALTSGHRGCLTTCHAASAAAGLRRIETLAALAGSGLSAQRLGGLVLDGLDAVVVTDRRGADRGIREVAMVDGGRLVPRWSRSSRLVDAGPDRLAGPVNRTAPSHRPAPPHRPVLPERAVLSDRPVLSDGTVPSDRPARPDLQARTIRRGAP